MGRRAGGVGRERQAENHWGERRARGWASRQASRNAPAGHGTGPVARGDGPVARVVAHETSTPSVSPLMPWCERTESLQQEFAKDILVF